MSSNECEKIAEAFDALDAAMTRVEGLSYEGLTLPELFALLERLDRLERELLTVEDRWRN